MNADRLFPRVWFLLAGNNYYLTCDLATQKRQYTNYKWFTWNIYLVRLLFLNSSGLNYIFPTGAACQQRRLPPPEPWSCHIFDLYVFIMSLSERVTFPD